MLGIDGLHCAVTLCRESFFIFEVLPVCLFFLSLRVQLRFPAATVDVKKRIESLIEREYLERDADQAAVYHYLA